METTADWRNGISHGKCQKESLLTKPRLTINFCTKRTMYCIYASTMQCDFRFHLLYS